MDGWVCVLKGSVVTPSRSGLGVANFVHFFVCVFQEVIRDTIQLYAKTTYPGGREKGETVRDPGGRGWGGVGWAEGGRVGLGDSRECVCGGRGRFFGDGWRGVQCV